VITERWPATHCWENARTLAQRHPELRVAAGWLIIPWPDGSEMFRLEHGWCAGPDGEIIDPSRHAYDGLWPFRYLEST
jgi:hypothetical protein